MHCALQGLLQHAWANERASPSSGCKFALRIVKGYNKSGKRPAHAWELDTATFGKKFIRKARATRNSKCHHQRIARRGRFARRGATVRHGRICSRGSGPIVPGTALPIASTARLDAPRHGKSACAPAVRAGAGAGRRRARRPGSARASREERATGRRMERRLFTPP